MIFGLLIGGVLLLAGTQMLGVVLQFYLGQRRDLYFHPDRVWQGHGRLGGALLIVGGALILSAMLSHDLDIPLVLLIAFLVAMGWWLVCPLLMNSFPPRWLARMERGRSAEDIEAIVNNGAALLEARPHHFRQIIHDEAGWDAWLMTITATLPMSTFETFVQRAEVAMQHHLHPVAVRAAERIIHYRPDHALGYQIRARAYYADRKFERALDDMNVCIEIEPANGRFYYQRAQIHLMLKHDVDAMQDIDNALRIEPDSPYYASLKVIARNRLGNH